MTNEYSHPLEHFREFANASRNLCRTLSLAGSHKDIKLLVARIIFVLQSFPDEVYLDDKLIKILDALVDDRLPLDSYLTEPWGSFLLTLGFAHIKRYEMIGALQDIERAFFLSELASTIVSRKAFPRLWESIQLLIGDSQYLRWSHSGDYSALDNALTRV